MIATQDRDLSDECRCTTCAFDKPKGAWRPADRAACDHPSTHTIKDAGGTQQTFCFRCGHQWEGCRHALMTPRVTFTAEGTTDCYYCLTDGLILDDLPFLDPFDGEGDGPSMPAGLDWGGSRPEAEAFRS